MSLRRSIPMFIAIVFGLLTLLSLALPVPLELGNVLLGWAAFLAAIALLLGVINLLIVHLNRTIYGRNVYSFVLIISMLAVFALAYLAPDQLTPIAFHWIQAPMEAALASLLAIFLPLAGFRMLKNNPGGWSLLFLCTVILILLGSTLSNLTAFLPETVTTLSQQVSETINTLIVTAGMRGILIGVALGTITFSIRLLIGAERPYNK